VRKSSHYESAVVRVQPHDDVREIVEEMIQYSVGCVVVADGEGRPLGVVTDRDLLERVVCAGLDPAETRADSIMTAHPVTCDTDEPLETVIERMQAAGVRRLPAVRDGAVVGLVAVDDIVSELGRELFEVREALRGEVLGARRSAQARRQREEVTATLEELRNQVAHLGADSVAWMKREIDGLRKRFGA